MWKVIYIAPNENVAKQLEELLQRNGFMCRLQVEHAGRKGGKAVYELQVPASEAADAYEVLCENGFHG